MGAVVKNCTPRGSLGYKGINKTRCCIGSGLFGGRGAAERS